MYVNNADVLTEPSRLQTSVFIFLKQKITEKVEKIMYVSYIPSYCKHI
jgi:hypothetical protein